MLEKDLHFGMPINQWKKLDFLQKWKIICDDCIKKQDIPCKDCDHLHTQLNCDGCCCDCDRVKEYVAQHSKLDKVVV